MNVSSNTAKRALPLQRRPELESRKISYRRQSYWSVKDPLTLRFFQFRDEEHFILSQLDGQTSLETLQQRFQERFAPRRIDLPQLNWFLGMLHREGLVVAETAAQGQQLLERRLRNQRKQFWSGLSNVLAIRFRGIDPSSLIEVIYPLVRWVYSPWCVSLVLILMLASSALLLLELPTVLQRLPSFGEFFSADNIVWMAVAIGLAKVLHELGHALTCRHFGGRCRELGLMFLVFTPCLYCNVSDAWMLRSKWRRIAVSAAGIYVELTLASVCLFLWWFSEAGVFNSLCLNLVVVCSIGTVLFNGNPLLRYDGYFIFADWCEIPNLAQRGSQYVRDLLGRFCAGIESSAVPPAPGERLLLVTYTLAAWAYRVVIMTAIFWLCYSALKPYGLQMLAIGLACLTVGGMVAMPIIETIAALRSPARRRKLSWLRFTTVTTVAGGAFAAMLLVPVPFRVAAPVILEAKDADAVYVTAAGRLVEAMREGQHVDAGQMIARLTNLELEKEVARLKAELAVQRSHVQSLTGLRAQGAAGDVSGPGGQLPSAKQAVVDLENRLQDRLAELDRLTIRAPLAGTILPPRPTRLPDTSEELAGWSGTPLEPRNQGGALASGTTVCLIGDPHSLIAQLLVEQSAIAFIRVGQPVRLYVDAFPGQFLTGAVTEIAQEDSTEPFPELVAKNLVPVRAGADQEADLSHTAYRVRVELDPYAASIPLRAAGRAVISVEPRTLGRRTYDFLCRTFRLEL